MRSNAFRWRQWPLVVVSLGLIYLLLATSAPDRANAAGDWLFPDRRMRVEVTIGANGYQRTDKIADVPFNFTALMSTVGASGPLEPDSLRVVEVTAAGEVLDAPVPFQFDPAPDYDPVADARGVLVILLDGVTGPSAVRHYHVYFDIAGAEYDAPGFTAQVGFQDGVADEGFASYKFETGNATYYYHKQGGGFSSLLDADENDWIAWNAAAGSAGDFRGIPNLVNPNDGGYFHPGRTNSTSTVLSDGPLKVTFKSTSSDKRWETIWEVYPDYARLTVTKTNSSYWFLYEGTPGGHLENADKLVRSNGNETAGFGSWTSDLTGEEWVYFRDANQARSLFLVHEEEDTIVDSYRAMDNEMTIFGFGRNGGSGRYLTKVPQHFIFGLVESDAHEAVTSAVYNAYKSLAIDLGPVESNVDGPICAGNDRQYYLSSKSAGSVEGISYEDADILKYDGSLCQWSLFFDGSGAGLPASADIDALEIAADGAIYLSFDQPLTVPGVGKIDDSDIVRYAGGAFELWFDGSFYGLSTSYEDVDAIAFDAEANLLVSTMGSFSVPGAGKGADEDLLRLAGGTWSLLFDGSHNAGLGREDVDGASWLADGTIALNTVDSFILGAVKGDGDDIFACAATSLGPKTTTCEYSLMWNGSGPNPTAVDAIGVVVTTGLEE